MKSTLALACLLLFGCGQSQSDQKAQLEETAWRTRESCGNATFWANHFPESRDLAKTRDEVCGLSKEMARIAKDYPPT